MKFRFTLYNTIAGSQIINEPDGWKGIKIKLQRHEEYHSLIQMIDTDFFYYNANNLVDGGRQFIYNVEQTQGINAIISLRIEVSEDSTNYDDVFTGNLDLSTIKDVSKGDKFYLFKCSLIPSDLWATFLNRKGTAVDMKSSTDLDGNPVVVGTSGTLALASQAVRKKGLYSQYGIVSLWTAWGYTFTATKKYATIDLPNLELDEITTKFSYPPGDASTDDPSASTSIALPLIEVTEPGTYAFDIKLVTGSTANGSGSTFTLAGLLIGHIQINNGTVDNFTETITTDGISTGNMFTYTGTKTLNVGDQIKIWIEWTFAGATVIYIIQADNTFATIYGNSYISIIADTLYQDTTTSYFLLHDSASAIIKRMTASAFNFYSDFFGGTTQGYAVNGCGYLTGIMKGLHVRGYSFSEKPFSMSFDDWWNGANPIFNLGLGPEFVSGVEKIRVEQKDHFYNDTPILTFSNVDNIERSYDLVKIVKSVKIGYNTWSAESGSGIDDPQTNHQYSTLFKLIGQELTISSSFVAASLAIEQTRRNRKQLGTDWRLDDNIIIIDLADTTHPQVDTPFTSITNLLNAATRYNVRFTPYRNLTRWLKLLSASLQLYLSSVFKFNSGEGNYTMAVGSNSDTCDTGTWTENQDVTPSSSPYTTAEMYRFVVPLSFADYQLWLANRTQCVLVSQTNTNHKKCHVQLMEYEIARGEATVTGWIK